MRTSELVAHLENGGVLFRCVPGVDVFTFLQPDAQNPTVLYIQGWKSAVWRDRDWFWDLLQHPADWHVIPLGTPAKADAMQAAARECHSRWEAETLAWYERYQSPKSLRQVESAWECKLAFDLDQASGERVTGEVIGLSYSPAQAIYAAEQRCWEVARRCRREVAAEVRRSDDGDQAHG